MDARGSLISGLPTAKGANKEHVLQLSLMTQWVGEGRDLRMALGPARACSVCH